MDPLWLSTVNKIIKTEAPDRVVYTLDGKLHREDGPALEYVGGSKYWFLNNRRHRENGPAVEHSNGDKEYWINDKYLDFITNDQMLIYYLKYGFLK